jgi:hypothetical protein
MSQQPPKDEEQWVPPHVYGDSPFDPRVLADKAEFVNKNASKALVFSIFGFLFCGLLNFYGFGLASSVIETVDYYNVARDKRGIAVAAKVIAVVGIVLWILGIIVRVMMS